NAELHDYYTTMLNNADTILYGRTTYELMEVYWPNLVKNPTGEKNMDDFANAIDRIGRCSSHARAKPLPGTIQSSPHNVWQTKSQHSNTIPTPTSSSAVPASLPSSPHLTSSTCGRFACTP